jgi:hydrogenase maturation protease
MKKVLVLGYGNPLRGDDGVGPAVARALQEKLEKLFTAEAQRTRRQHREGIEDRRGEEPRQCGTLGKSDCETPAQELGPVRGDSLQSASLNHSSDLLRAASASFASLRCNSVCCKALHQLTPELAPDVAQADLVIFIDASCDNGPGEVASRRVVAECAPSNTSFSHQLTPEVLLAFAERLYGTCPEAVLLSVGAASFEYGEGLSAEVQAAVPVLLDRVQAACAALHS